MKTRRGRTELKEVMRELGRRKILSVLLEAGPNLNGAALEAGIVDKIVLFYAPKFIGERGVPLALLAAGSFRAAGRAAGGKSGTIRAKTLRSRDTFTMFTGIIERAGKIEALDATSDGGRLRVNFGDAWRSSPLKISDSIAVNGCCLTVTQLGADSFCADLSGETLRRTALGEMKPGAAVNLERPLAAGDRLGGHFVQGHVDAVGRVTRLVGEGESWWLSVRVPEDFRRYVAEKGSIAIDGISLTVARWNDGVADFAIIPFTYEQTNVKGLVPGDAVNIECDVLAKYVEALLVARTAPGVSRIAD